LRIIRIIGLIYLFLGHNNFDVRDEKIKLQWEEIQVRISKLFGGGETLDVDAIIYLIGVQELGQGNRKFKKDEKLDIMHVAVCTLLEPFGYYEFDYFDEEGWPHFKVLDELPYLKPGEQSVLMKEAIVMYFEKREVF